jgi:hypothetical protein
VFTGLTRVKFTLRVYDSQLTTPQKEFETIMTNRQVVARLNELEALVADATRRRLESTDPSSPPVAYVLPFPISHPLSLFSPVHPPP